MNTTTNTKTAARPVKKEGYSFAKQQARRNQRRVDAEKRDAVYAGLSLGDRINLANARPGYSRRELARLHALKKAKASK